MNTATLTVNLRNVAEFEPVAKGRPYVNKKGQTIVNYETRIFGVGLDGCMVRVRIANAEEAKVKEAVARFPVGKPAIIPIWPRIAAAQGTLSADYCF